MACIMDSQGAEMPLHLLYPQLCVLQASVEERWLWIFEEYLGLDDAGDPWADDCYPSMVSSMETPCKALIRSFTACFS